MEMFLRSKRIGPLSGGDRRGTPGADAGCDSIRTVSGEESNRRAPSGSPENTTANHTNDNSSTSSIALLEPYNPSTTSYIPDQNSREAPTPTLSVAQAVNTFLPASTKAGKPRVRMRWSQEVNTFIMRTYYYITKLETDMTTYRKQLHELFSQNYPDINVSEQRISDQRRTIVRNKLLSAEILNQLKEEVKTQLQLDTHNHFDTNPITLTNYTHNDTQSQTQYRTQSQLSPYTQISHTSTQTQSLTMTIENDIDTIVEHNPEIDIHIQEIQDKFRTAITQYSGMNPAARPKLPKLKYSYKLSHLIHLFNQNILHQFISDETLLVDIHTIIYCTALVISEELNYKITNFTRNSQSNHSNKPPWQIRLERDIEKLRADCGRLTQYINNNRSNKVVKRVEAIFKSSRTHTVHESMNRKPEEFLDTLKQKLALKVHRLRRYKKAQQRKSDNNLFTTNEKIFYRNLHTPKTDTTVNTETPTKTQLETFWTNIWEKQVQHNEKADWITEEENKWSSIEEMKFDEITESDITSITARLHNWKSPGIDKIHNYWYKKLTSLHSSIAKNLTDIILGKQIIPEFIATGLTYMLPKTTHSSQPSQYRPITCLPTIYKILTSVIANKINTHIEHNNILAEEQKGCRRGHMGCKEQLIIDSTIHKHATAKNRNLHCTYIDYKKAFDSIPHSWLLKILQIYKINTKITDFMRKIMPHWKTTLQLNSRDNVVLSRQITIKKGIYQGDSLSPLWFCLALNPLSNLLRRCQAGYCLKHASENTNEM